MNINLPNLTLLVNLSSSTAHLIVFTVVALCITALAVALILRRRS